MKADKIKPGMTLYDAHSERAGNTNIRVMGVWRVKVLEVHETHVIASWNGNPAKAYAWAIARKWRESPPEWGRYRVMRAQSCYVCGAEADAERSSAAHKPTCSHPRAVAHRKRVERAAVQKARRG